MRRSRVQKCKGERHITSGGRWRPQVAGGGKMYRVGLSALAQPRLIKGDQPYLRPDVTSCHLPPGAATRHLRMGLLSLNLSLTGEMIYSLPFPRGFYPAQAAPSAPPRADDSAASAPAGGDRGRGCAGAGTGTEA